MNKKEVVYKQNISDLSNVIAILGKILEGKKLTEEEERRITYCEKTIKTVTVNIKKGV